MSEMDQKRKTVPVDYDMFAFSSHQVSYQEPDIPLGDPEDLLPAHRASEEKYKKHVENMKRFAQEHNVHFFEFKKITAPPPFPSTYPDVLDSISGHYGAFFFPIPGYTYSPPEDPTPVKSKPVVQEPVKLLKRPPGLPSPRRHPSGRKRHGPNEYQPVPQPIYQEQPMPQPIYQELPIMQYRGRNNGRWIGTTSRPIQQVHPFSHFTSEYPSTPPFFYTCGNR
ncbi:hypothetical protein GCK72_023085 [Caenorhabditis remanei]|uniref:Uncharacterized protein n=1 Tax=Caenorhabditis remanei TaxID=31234 RepID=A0A6A5FVI6_CAERE|nr:hypothetical protein GCK72_023085 [Caenorhabditis remanei]KAF1746628.1 hypothetical protein GCK72_023085 [Caenorhabditis remanei]